MAQLEGYESLAAESMQGHLFYMASCVDAALSYSNNCKEMQAFHDFLIS